MHQCNHSAKLTHILTFVKHPLVSLQRSPFQYRTGQVLRGLWYLKHWLLKRTEISKIEFFSAYISDITVVIEGYNEFNDTIQTPMFFFEVTGEQTWILILGGLCRFVWANGVSLHLHSCSRAEFWVLQLNFKPVPLSPAYWNYLFGFFPLM